MSIPEQSPRDIEYEAIEEAIMQNPRGRWFLNEYARRNRVADTDRLVDAIEHLYRTAIEARAKPQEEAAPGTDLPDANPPSPNLDVIRRALHDMRHTINAARTDMAAVKPRTSDHFPNPEYDATTIVSTTERATLDILAAVERLQDIADTLRGSGADADLCDEIETHARGIFMSSAYQDMTGQRMAHLVTALTALDHRIGAVLDLDDFNDD
jgi:hypothetical protein